MSTEKTSKLAIFEGRRIRKITPDDTVTVVAESGWFWQPSGVAVDAGNIYVLEHSLATSDALGFLAFLKIGPYIRVRRIEANGTATILATIWGKNSLFVAGVSAGLIVLIGLAHRIRQQNEKRAPV